MYNYVHVLELKQSLGYVELNAFRTDPATAAATRPDPVDSFAADVSRSSMEASVLTSGALLLGTCGVRAGGICEVQYTQH